jgi:ribosomal protein L12E/L44/L45/RPP1/RPP2
LPKCLFLATVANQSCKYICNKGAGGEEEEEEEKEEEEEEESPFWDSVFSTVVPSAE